MLAFIVLYFRLLCFYDIDQSTTIAFTPAFLRWEANGSALFPADRPLCPLYPLRNTPALLFFVCL